jgi:WD40 repeat protein
MPMPLLRLCSLLVLVTTAPVFAAAPPVGRYDLYGDPLPGGAVARLGSVRWRRAFALEKPALSPDGQWLVSTAYFEPEDTLLVWEVATGRLRHTLNRRMKDCMLLQTFTFTPDGKHLFSCDAEGKVLSLWSFPSGKLRWMRRGPGIEVNALAISRDGRLAAAGASNGQLYLYDFPSLAQVHSFPGDRKVLALAFSADGCLSVVEQGATKLHFRVRRLDLLTRRELRCIVVGPVNAGAAKVHLSPDGQYVAAILKKEVYLWEVKSGKRRQVRSISFTSDDWADEWIQTLAFSPDGRTLAAVGVQFIWLCDVGSTNLTNRIRWSDRSPLSVYPVFSPDNRMFGVSDESEVMWWDTRSARPVQHRPGFPNLARALCYSRDGRSMIVVSPLDVSRWDTSTGQRRDYAFMEHWRGIWPLPGDSPLGLRPEEYVSGPRFSPGGTYFVRPLEKVIEITQTQSQKRRLLSGHNAHVRALALSSDGRLLASADDREVRLWEFSTGKELWRSDTTSFARIARGLAFSPDGRKLALGENRARLHLLDVITGKLLVTLQQEGKRRVDALIDFPDGEWAGVFSNNGDLIYSAHRDTFRVWDLKQGRAVLTEKSRPIGQGTAIVPRRPFTALTVSADGRFLGRIDPWGTLSIYELASLRRLYRVSHATQPISFAPSGWQIAAMNQEESSILIWDLGTLFRSLPPPRLGAQTVATLWADLAHRDAGLAHRALWRMAVLPGMEHFLDSRLRLPPLSNDRLKQHLADLGSDDFAIRQEAEEAIAKLGAAALPVLESALAKTEDLEQRRRLERLLRPLDLDGTGALRMHRAVLALEARGTPAARKLLGRLAAGTPGARLTEEAKKAVKRMADGAAKG